MDKVTGAQSAAKLRSGIRLSRELILALILVGCMGAFGALNTNFLSALNFHITARYLVEVGLVAISMTMLMVIRGIDLSVGSIVAVCSVVFGFSWQFFHIPLIVSGLLAVAAGLIAGLVNAFFVSQVKVPDLVVTISTLAIFRGLAVGLAGSRRVYLGDISAIEYLGSGLILGVPVSLWVLIPAVLVGGFVLSRSSFGRQIYLIGNNETAARYAGINADRIRSIAYILSGFLCAIAAILYCARVGTANSNAGSGLEFDVITGVVLGGTGISGGEGSIWGSILGLMLVIVLENGLNLMGVASPVQSVVIGAILVITVLVNENLKRK
jgi:rhamnose transport system permease protein